MNATSVIGIDVGGTKIAAGLLSMPNGEVLTRKVIPTRPQRGGSAVLADVLQLAQELSIEAGRQHFSVTAIGLGICELVRDGQPASANCIQWLDLPVQEQLNSIAPAVIEADVRAAALAEYTWGAARQFRVSLFVTIGTGISCCLLLNGQPYTGATGATGTMASSAIRVPCDHDAVATSRTLEQIASGPALVERFNARGGTAESAEEVVAAASGGDSTASEILRSAIDALGSQIALLVNVLDPEAIVIGGGLGLGLATGSFADQFTSAIRRDTWSEKHRAILILPAATGPDAGWMGAAASACRAFDFPLKTAAPHASSHSPKSNILP